MLDKQLIKIKMEDMQGYLRELEPLLKEEAREIIDNNLKLHTLERLFQLVVDTAVSINTHIISESSYQMPDDYQSTFMSLGEQKILPVSFALKIGPAVGLRNLIIHKYGKVDLKKMVDDIKNEIGDFVKYLRYISDYLRQK